MIRDLDEGNGGDGAGIASKISSTEGFSRGFGAKGRARAPAPESLAEVWRLEPHVCRACFSRLVSRSTETRVLDAPPSLGIRLYHCPNCGVEALGRAPDVLCSCGLKIRKATRGGRSSVVLADAGIRCAPNVEIRADFPSLFVALEVAPPM